MKDEPQPQSQTQTETPIKAQSIFGPTYWAVMAVIYSLGGAIFFQEPIVGVLQGGSIERVNELATKAGRAAEAECAKPGTGADTYEVIRDLAEPKLIFNNAAYTPSGLADTLERLEESKVAVRKADGYENRVSAVFRKGADGRPDTLALGGMSSVDDLTVTFIERVIAEGPGMKPGEMMILHNEWKDGLQSTIVHAPAGAQEYQAVWSDTPFLTGEVREIPPLQCRLD